MNISSLHAAQAMRLLASCEIFLLTWIPAEQPTL
jgi:hypothetical protein